MKILKPKIYRIFSLALGVLILVAAGCAQSRDQNFPTAIAANEISGTVNARDIGDSRVTSYYYAFQGNQGDVFINVVTKNLTGDIDIFTQDGLKTLTKIIVFADPGLNETGRLIYLRKEEKLLLRIQGRTPNDDPATFKIKFGGSFVAIKGAKEEAAPTIEPAADKSQTVVNSVGTIVEIKPKSQPLKELPQTAKEAEIKKVEKTAKAAEVKEKSAPSTAPKKPEVVIGELSEELPKTAKKTNSKSVDPPKATTKPAREEKKPDPLASIRLLIQMKDGSVIERPMSEVLKFSVDKGVLTVISKSGSISKFSIFDVEKVTIE